MTIASIIISINGIPLYDKIEVMAKTANIIGATGLVGRELVNQLLLNDEIGKVRIFVRREFNSCHPKIEQHIVDFDDDASWKPFLQGDILFSTMGTTLKQAGSKASQYKIDYTYQYRFAEEASKAGIPVYVLVSSAGANSKSLLFYSRIKGELDDAVQKFPFEKVIILRPSILDGIREKPRPLEEKSIRAMRVISRFLFKKFRPVPAATVAKAMIRGALGKEMVKNSIVNPEEIFNFARV
jgi:uncharacterized protein YbjT (DUF2867 family)